MRDAMPPCKFNFATANGVVRDDRTVAQRLGDALSESHREDTSTDFRLGLLQGALAIAMPEIIDASRVVNIRVDAQDFLKQAELTAGKARRSPRAAFQRRPAGMRETRAHAIHAHVLMAIKHTALDQAEFADDVARIYIERTPLHARHIDFHAHQRGVDPYDVRRANEQLLWRMLKPSGPVRMPVEIEEAVVLALPQPYRDECLRELNARYGLLAAAMPVGAGASLAEQVKSPCELMRKAATAVERIAPMLEDGRIGPEDQAHFAEALRAINDMQGCGITLVAQIADAMSHVAPPPSATTRRPPAAH